MIKNPFHGQAKFSIATTIANAYCCVTSGQIYSPGRVFSILNSPGCDSVGFLRMTVQGCKLSPFVLSLPTCRPPRFNGGFKTEMNNF